MKTVRQASTLWHLVDIYDLEVVRLLDQKDLSGCENPDGRSTALHCAVKSKRLEVARLLLDREVSGASIEACCSHGLVLSIMQLSIYQ
jgi:hypothetical protein